MNTINVKVESWYRQFKRDLFWWIVIGYFVIALVGWLAPKDSTNPVDGRSGLRPHIDALTGCQYLSGQEGGITPRLDASGKQICRRPE